MLKLGYKASAEQFGPVDLLQFAVLTESLGWDSVWVSDHFQPFRHNRGHAPFSMAWLGALGARTSRVTLGTSVLTPTFRYHPAIVAQAFATLGVLFPNRVALGIGTGESLNEVPATGMAWPEQRERTARLREAVGLIKSLWSNERVSFEGQYYRTRNATIYDRPSSPVPIYIAGAGPVMAKLAATDGEGFICTSGKPWKLYTETLLTALQAGLETAGQERAQNFERMIEMKVSFDTDPSKAMSDTRYWGALALSPEEKMNVEDPLEMESLSDSLPLERTASRWIVTTDPEEMVERIGAYCKLGFNHLVFHSPSTDQARFIRLFSDRVISLLRAKFA